MARGNGSYMGQTVNPNSNVASGIWTVREAETYLRADKWPAQPTVPSAPSGTAGDGEVELTWTAPTGGSTPTDYIIQYSSDGGASWTTFSDGVSTATAATVTGLTNGTGYIFRIIAVNALGQGPAGSASGTITPAGLDVSLLLHFDGANGSTTFTDSGSNALTVTANGDAAISTAQSKFGGASGYFDGSGDFLSADGSEGFDFGAGDFTIEAWLYVPDNGNLARMIASAYDEPSSPSPFAKWLFYVNGTRIDFLAESGSQSSWSLLADGSGAIPRDTWFHAAVSRSAGVVRIFVNGVDTTGSVTNGGSSLISGDTVAIGSVLENGSNRGYFDGYIDELRIVKGTAVYTANFTPPTAPF